MAGIAFIIAVLLYAYSIHLDAKKAEEAVRKNAKPKGWVE